MANQDQNDTPSRISKISVDFRKREIARNTYNKNDEYVSTHPNTLSDGDTKGKGEKDGSIGSSVDVEKRFNQLAKNKYTNNNPYCIDNA